MNFTIDNKVNLAFALSLLIFLYTLLKDGYKIYHSRFKMKSNIVEWRLIEDGLNKAFMMRIQLINNSNSPITVSHIDITDNECNVMSANDFSHIMFFRKIDAEDYKEPIKTTQFPITISPHTGENICVLLETVDEVTEINKTNTKLLLETNKGMKELHFEKVLPHLSDIHFFS